MGKTWRAGEYDSSGYEKVEKRNFYGFSVFRGVSDLQYGQIAADLIQLQRKSKYKGVRIRGHDLEAAPAMQIIGMYETVRVPDLKKKTRDALMSIIHDALVTTIQKPKPKITGVGTFGRGGRQISVAAQLCPNESNFTADRESVITRLSELAVGHDIDLPKKQSHLTLVRVGHRVSAGMMEDLVGEVSQIVPEEIHLQPPTIHIPDTQAYGR